LIRWTWKVRTQQNVLSVYAPPYIYETLKIAPPCQLTGKVLFECFL